MNQGSSTQPSDYTYRDAGFNGFFRRSLGSDSQMTVLSSMGKVKAINFDLQQASGNLGDVVRFGKCEIDGRTGRFNVRDDNDNIVTTLGALDG